MLENKCTPNPRTCQPSPWKSHLTACLDRVKWSIHSTKNLPEIIKAIAEAIPYKQPGKKGKIVHQEYEKGSYFKGERIQSDKETVDVRYCLDHEKAKFRPAVEIDCVIARNSPKHRVKTLDQYATHLETIAKIEEILDQFLPHDEWDDLFESRHWYAQYVETCLLFQDPVDRGTFLRSMLIKHNRSPKSARHWDQTEKKMVRGYTKDVNGGAQYHGHRRSPRAMVIYDQKAEIRLKRAKLKSMRINTAMEAYERTEEIFQKSLYLVKFSETRMLAMRKTAAFLPFKQYSETRLRRIAHENHAADLVQWMERVTGWNSTKIRHDLTDPMAWPEIRPISIRSYCSFSSHSINENEYIHHQTSKDQRIKPVKMIAKTNDEIFQQNQLDMNVQKNTRMRVKNIQSESAKGVRRIRRKIIKAPCSPSPPYLQKKQSLENSLIFT